MQEAGNFLTIQRGPENVGSMPGRKVESAWYQPAAWIMDGWRWRSKVDGDFGDPSLFKKFIYTVHHNVAGRPQDLHRTQSEHHDKLPFKNHN